MTDKPPSERSPQRPLRREGEIEPWALASLGVQFAVGLVVGVYAGQWIDRRLGSEPLGLVLGAFLGGGGIFISSYRRLMAKSRRDAAAERAHGESGGAP